GPRLRDRGHRHPHQRGHRRRGRAAAVAHVARPPRPRHHRHRVVPAQRAADGPLRRAAGGHGGTAQSADHDLDCRPWRRRTLHWLLVRTTGGYVPVVRSRHGDPALFHHVDRCLASGGAIAIFPEGNYGPAEGGLMPFHKGFAHFAIKAGVPVVPVGLSGTRDVWFRKTIKVFVGERMPSAGQDPAALTETAFERVRALVPAYVEPPGRKPLRRFLTNLF